MTATPYGTVRFGLAPRGVFHLYDPSALTGYLDSWVGLCGVTPQGMSPCTTARPNAEAHGQICKRCLRAEQVVLTTTPKEGP